MKMFAGPAIPGLTEAMQRIYADRDVRLRHPRSVAFGAELRAMPTDSKAIELDDLVAALAQAGISGPNVRDHVEWLSVNDPRVVKNGNRIRSFKGTE